MLARRSMSLLGGLVAAAWLAGCRGQLSAADGSPPQPSASAPLAEAPPAPAPPPAAPVALAIEPAAGVRQGSAVALGKLDGRRVALVADADGPAVHVIDREAGRVLSSLALPAAPAQLLITRDGRALASLEGGNEVLVLAGHAGGSLSIAGSIATAAGPFGLALSPDGATVLAASYWGRRLEGFSWPARERLWSVELPRDPRSVAVTDDGKRAFVSHAVGSIMSVVDLPPGEAAARPVRLDGVTNMPSYMGNHSYRFGVQGFSLALLDGRVLAPQALSNAGIRKEKMGAQGGGGMGFFDDEPGPRKRGGDDFYGGGGEDPYAITLQDVAVVNAAKPWSTADTPALYHAGKLGEASSHFLHLALGKTLVAEPTSVVISDGLDAATANLFNACALPSAAAVDEASKSLLVACLGSDVVLELDATAGDPARRELRRFSVPAGPWGVAIDPKSREALVFSRFDRALVSIELGPESPPQKGKARPVNKATRVDGKLRVPTLSFKGLAGLPPAERLSASQAEGRRLFYSNDNPQISGDGRACASCHPGGLDDGLVWATPEGPRQTPALAGRALASTGPFGWTGGHATAKIHLKSTFRRLRGKGLDEASIDSLLDYVASMPAPPRGPAGPEVARGKEIYEGASGCAACHGAPGYADHLAHDVKSGGTFDTPSLLLVGGTAPYFHDGRYRTLREVLLDCEGKMGSTAGLSPQDLAALEAYLLSL